MEKNQIKICENDLNEILESEVEKVEILNEVKVDQIHHLDDDNLENKTHESLINDPLNDQVSERTENHNDENEKKIEIKVEVPNEIKVDQVHLLDEGSLEINLLDQNLHERCWMSWLKKQKMIILQIRGIR